MGQPVLAGDRCELTPPIYLSTINDRNKESIGCNMNSPKLSPLPKPKGVDLTTQPSASVKIQSAQTNTYDPVITCDQLPRASIEYDAEKLSSPQTPVASVTMHIPRIHNARTSKEELTFGRLISPPLSSTPVDVRPAKPRRQTASRTSITRKQASRKRTLWGWLSNEDVIMLKTLPKESRTFAEREMCWSNAQAGSDFMLTLPVANHRYVDGKKRLTYNDLRFTASGKRKNDSSCFLFAGIPSNKPYAPYHEAASPPVQFAAFGSSEGSTFDETANDASQEEAFHSRPSIKLIIPDVIKALLVDDWENVTKNTQLVPLPHQKPVTKILEDYSAYEMPKRPAGSSHADILEETLSGLKEYFDKSLGRILLYKFERPQYAEVHKKWNSTDPEFQGKAASDIYGAEHLCRLIVSLPELLAQTNMDQQSVNRLREELAKFSTWLSKNATEYFASSYETPTQDYADKAKN